MTPEARAARERKQKIFLAVGGLVLVALLAFQLPKLLGGSGSSSTAASATTTETSAETSTSTSTGSATPAAGTATPIVVAAAVRPDLVTGKLSSFGLFRRKDPFIQQVATDAATTAAASAASSAKDATSSGAAGGKKAANTAGASGKFTVGAKSASTPALTVLSVNSTREALQPGGTFPSSDPVFVLVSEHPGSKSVQIGVVGGAYAGGSKTTTLKVGKPLTLVNTATGARYRISLVAVGSGQSSSGTADKPASSSTPSSGK
jgi:hypothetical protein